MFCFIGDYSSTVIKTSLQYAHKLLEGFDIVDFEYFKEYFGQEQTQFRDEDSKTVATYDHSKKELWVWCKSLREELDKLNYGRGD